MAKLPIILASESPARLELLAQIKIIPDQILPAFIDETPKLRELPKNLVIRLAEAKAQVIATKAKGIIIAADSVVVAGRKILPKASTIEEIRDCLKILSQRRHRVYTGICITKNIEQEFKISKKIVQTIIKFKKLTNKEIEFYCNLGEGLNKAGGYSVKGHAECFITYIAGSYSNVVGLPLYTTSVMLNSLGL